ncbi:MAG: hypothetical protein QXJ48_05965 [Candidatus Korarchaeum sp.]
MWISEEEVEGWVKVRMRRRTFWVMPPNARDFGVEVLSKGFAEDYLKLIRKVPEIASLPLAISQLEGDAIAASRWWLNMRKLEGSS